MANETTMQNPEVDDECGENIPPGGTDTKLKVQAGDMVEDSSSLPSGNKSLSDTYTFSTPAPASNNGAKVKTKSRLSGLQSALTPILKILNIANKSPDPLKHRSNPYLNPPSFSLGVNTTNSGPSSRDGCWLHDEFLPEITLLDVTCDSTMQMTRNDSALPDSAPATPVTTKSTNSIFSAPQCSQPTSASDLNTTAQKSSSLDKTVDPPQSVTSPQAESEVTDQASSVPMITTEAALIHPPKLSVFNRAAAGTDSNSNMVDTRKGKESPECWMDGRFLPEITLLDVTHDSEPSPGAEISTMDVTQDMPPVDGVENGEPLSELSGQSVTEPDRLDTIQSEELSSTFTGSVTHTISSFSEQTDHCGEENVVKASLEVTRDISMGSVSESSRSSAETSTRNMLKTQTSAEDTTDTHPVNVTHDISSSSDMSVQCATSQCCASDVQCNGSVKNVTCELHVRPVETSNTVEATSEALLHDAEVTAKGPQSSPEMAPSANGTFTIAQNSSTELNTTTQTSCPQNKTMDLPPSDVNSPKAENEAINQVSEEVKVTTETALVMNQSCSPVKASGFSHVQNTTFNRNSLQSSNGSANLGEGGATFCLQNTFDNKPLFKQNGTIILSEISSNDSKVNAADKPSPSKVCNTTTSPQDNSTETQPPEESKQNGTATSTESNAKVVDCLESTFDANQAAEEASRAARNETKDHSQSSLPGTDCLSESLSHPSIETVNNKAKVFNLDDTLDLKADSLITSTPMTNCKSLHLNVEREQGKVLGAQKKLYRDGPSAAAAQPPSNIISDRKTFLTQPAAKSLMPPLKAHLLKFKPASAIPGRCEPLTSGLPMTRQRTQADALKSTAASGAAQTTSGISSSYNLRATTTGSRQPNSGLPRPQLSGIPSGIQRPTVGLRPPSARSNAAASSSTDKVRGPTAANPVTKSLQAKKHPLTREVLPTAKRKKTDPAHVSAEASASSFDSVNRTKTLKQPITGQRAFSAKTKRDDAVAPTSAAETTASCDASSKSKTLKPPAANHRAIPAKPQTHSCTKCAALEEQLKLKSEEITRLKEELLKYTQQQEQC